MELLVIGLTEDKSNPLYSHPDCQQLLGVYEKYYPKVGFHIPRVSYFVVRDNKIVGSCGSMKLTIY